MAFSNTDKLKIFRNAGRECEKCSKSLVYHNHHQGERGAWHAHHKIAVQSGGKDIPSNGQALCISCHKTTRTYGRSKK